MRCQIAFCKWLKRASEFPFCWKAFATHSRSLNEGDFPSAENLAEKFLCGLL